MRIVLSLSVALVLAPALAAGGAEKPVDPELDAIIQAWSSPSPVPRLGIYHDATPTGINYHAKAVPPAPVPRSTLLQLNQVNGQIYVLDGTGFTSRQTGLPSPPCPADG